MHVLRPVNKDAVYVRVKEVWSMGASLNEILVPLSGFSDQ